MSFDERYYVWRIISAGYFSEGGDSGCPMVVYTMCQRRKDKVNVAVKAIKLDLIDDERVKERCLLEAAIISDINRPNIVKLFDCFEELGALYLEMELFEETSTLLYAIKEQVGTLFPEKQIGAWFVQIAAALKYFHQKKLIHQNIKSANVFLVSNKKQAKLGGYIVPRPLDKTIEITDPPDTIKHMAPELSALVNSKTERIYGPEADVWSLGVLLYEMATLSPPFESGNQLQLFKKMTGSSPKHISDDYSVDLRNLVEKLLTKSPTKRPGMPHVMMDPFVRRHLPAIFPEMLKD